LFTLFFLIVAIIVLILLTREYSWNYTHPPVIPGGYPLDVESPAAHAAMEAEALARPPVLVQILSTTPETMSVHPQTIPPRPPPPPPPPIEDPS
jgi:hypothetical protein